MSTDALSDVLRTVRLEGAVFYDVHARTPWAASAPPARELAPHVLPGSEHVIEYHLVAAGRCWGNVDGQTPTLLEEGDIVVFPQGDSHVLASEPTRLTNQAPVNRIRRPAGSQLPVTIVDGGNGELVHLVCGFIGCDARPFNPLLLTLPRMIHVRGGASRPRHAIAYYVNAPTAVRRGADVVTARAMTPATVSRLSATSKGYFQPATVFAITALKNCS